MSDPTLTPSPGGAVPQLDAGAAVSYGWEKFKTYPLQFIVLVLAVFGVQLVWSFISNFITPRVNGIFGILLSIGIAAIGLALAFVVEAGVWRASLGVTRGQVPSFSQFTQTDNLAPFALTAIFYGLIAAIGFLLCIIPGIVWLIFGAYAPILALEKGMGPVEAFSTSINFVRNNLGQVFLILLVCWLIGIAGVVLCCVGVLVTYPISRIAIVHSYRALTNEPVVP